MDTRTAAKITAALQQADGVLNVESARGAGINKVTLKRAADAGVVLHTARNRYVAPDAPKRDTALKGAYLGQEAVLAYDGGAHYWGLDAFEQFALTWCIPHGGRPGAPNVHRRRRFDELEIVDIDGVRVTSVAQTLVDLGAMYDIDRVERAVESALRKGLITDPALRAFVNEQGVRRPGVRTLRAVLALRRPGARPTGSDLETLCLQLYRRGGLFPERQWEVLDEQGALVGFGDFGFPPKAFISEVDGLVAHGPEKREYDYNRQARIEDLGYTFRRFTRAAVLWRPRYVCATTRRGLLLARDL